MPKNSDFRAAGQYVYVCYTLNNPKHGPEAWLERVKEVFDDRLAYHVFQEEKVSTRHYQGYIELAWSMRGKKIAKNLDNAHCERRYGTQDEAIKYCSDPAKESYVAGPWSTGTPRLTEQGRRSDIEDAVETLKEGGMRQVFLKHPATLVKYHSGLAKLEHFITMENAGAREVDVTLLIGPGGVGKSHYAWNAEEQLQPDLPMLYRMAPIDNLYYWDKYEGQRAIFLDEFVGSRNGDEISRTRLNKVLDRWPYTANKKHGNRQGEYERIYIGTNIHPRQWYDFTPETWTPLARRITRVCLWDWDRPEEPRQPDHIYERGTDDFKDFMSL